MNRYLRQEIIPEVGAQGQNALGQAHILIVGAGGLGCPALQYLVGAGVGSITLVDPDTVATSNLHRQTLYRDTDVGRPKSEAAARSLASLNSDCVVTPLSQALTPANAPDLVRDADIVLDCADSFAVSYTLSDICLALNTPLICASALGLTGYVGGFCASAPSLRALFPDLPAQAASCDTAGVLGPVVGTIGALQAQMALNILLDFTPSPLGQLISLDMKTLRSSGFRFDAATEPEQTLRFTGLDTLTGDEFIVDLRGIDEAAQPAHSKALRLTVGDFEARDPPTPGSAQSAILICRSGLRAWRAATQLQTYWDGPISLIAMGDVS